MRESESILSCCLPWTLTDDFAPWADIIVTMGWGNRCPYTPGERYLDWNLSDPAGKAPASVHPIRDEIHRRVRESVDHL